MRNHLISLSKHILADGYPIEMDMENSLGSYIQDTNGDKYLDMFTMFASSPIGYNHPSLVAQKDFLGRMAINKPALSDIYPSYFAHALEVFSRVAIPKELSYCFFIAGGALAVENALKASFDWKTKLNNIRGINTHASMAIHFNDAFHGRSGYTLSLTNTNDPRKYNLFPKFNWPRVINPKLAFPISRDSLKKTIKLEENSIEQIHKAIKQYPNQIACIIIEPIQSEGGDHHFRKEFFIRLRQICDENEILLIFDEVQTGLGITGKMWAYQHFEITPDILVFGKKTQVCGILANRAKMDEVSHHVFQESSRISSTFGGDFLDFIRFRIILEIIEKENLIYNAEKMGKYLLKKIQLLVSQKEKLSNARGRGLMVAFDFDCESNRDNFVKEAFDRNLIILGCGKKSIRFRPSLNIDKKTIDNAIEIIKTLC